MDIHTNVTVERIQISQGRATSVVTAGNGPDYETRQEIIISAGALNSLLLLQRSGIGDGVLLNSLGLEVAVHNPAVGQSLREHKSISINVALTGPWSHNQALRGPHLMTSLLRYALRRPGALSSTYEVSAFLKTIPGLAQPDAELMMWAVTSDRNSDRKLAPESEPAMLLMGYPLRTESTGSICITGIGPDAPARIEANFMRTEHDRNVTIGLFRFMRQLISQPELKPLVRAESFPGDRVSSDADIIDYCLRSPTCFHAVGSCSMGGNEEAVVDPLLRVRGVSGLRVVACSVMPTQISGNTNGPLMALSLARRRTHHASPLTNR